MEERKPAQYVKSLETKLAKKARLVLSVLRDASESEPGIHYHAGNIVKAIKREPGVKVSESEMPSLLEKYIQGEMVSCVAIRRGGGQQIGYAVYPDRREDVEELILELMKRR